MAATRRCWTAGLLSKWKLGFAQCRFDQFASVALAVMCIAFGACGGYGQTQTGAAPPYAMKFFLDAPPTKDDLANLPPQARNIIVAKVRISKSVWLGRRDQSGMPAPLPKNILWAQVQLVDVLSGGANTGDQLDVFIATMPTLVRFITPVPPETKARQYFIVTFLNTENERQLLGLPASREEFDTWMAGLIER